MISLLPTDTCYGLAGAFTREDYEEIYRLKGRDFSKQLAILVEDFPQMKEFIEITDEQIEFLKSYPHPWSFLGKRNPHFALPDFMEDEKYAMISLRVAKVCLKCPPDNGSICLKSPPDKGGRVFFYIPYGEDLTTKARENRKNMNAPERRMWYDVLHSERLKKHKFLRQKPLLDYIVDFYCQELSLVIEIDGDSHGEMIEYDKERTMYLQSYGLEVLRFSNHEVMNQTESVYATLLEYITLKIKLTNQVGINKTPLYPPLSGGQIRFPLFLTSANLAGHPESKTLAEARGVFPGIEGIDGGVCDRPPSDIFSIGEDEELKYVRKNY